MKPDGMAEAMGAYNFVGDIHGIPCLLEPRFLSTEEPKSFGRDFQQTVDFFRRAVFDGLTGG